MEGPAGADVGGEAVGELPVVLGEVLFDVVAGTDSVFLEVDLEGVDLAEEKAGDGVAAVGDALLIGAGGGEGEGAGWIGRGDGVELIPAEVDAGFEGVRAADEDEAVDELPDGGLVAGEGAGGGAELLESGEGEEGQRVVEGGVGGDAGNAEGGGCGVAEICADDGVAAAGVAEAEVVEQARGEGVGLVEDGLLAEDVGEAGDATGAEDRAADEAAAVGERGDGLFDFVVEGVAAEGAVAGAEGAVDADVELALVVGVVGGAACSCWRRR